LLSYLLMAAALLLSGLITLAVGRPTQEQVMRVAGNDTAET
jgi:hypothetical protein